MAISKILHMKDCGTAFHGKHLKSALEYITVPEKTQNGRLVSAVNCQVASAFEQMKSTKQKFNKVDKRQAYHIILSFKAGEVDADTVFELAEKFVKEYLGDKFEAVFAVHDNTDHPHAHIVFNSVSFKDGSKYHYRKGDWERYIQPITNRLCEEYGLSTIELDEEPGGRKGKEAYKEWNTYRDGKFSFSKMVARDVDACILQATTFDSFISRLEDKGYEVKNANGEGKYLAVKPQGMKRYVRLKTLGDDYTEERIRQRIVEENLSSYHREEKPKIVYCRVCRYKRAKMSGLQKKYYARLYRIGKLKKRAYSVAWKYKDEIKKMQKLQAQYLFLVRHDIHSLEELILTEDSLTDKKKAASAEKSKLYRANSKNKELYDIAKQMDELVESEHAYQNGDSFFEDEHKEWVALETKLKELGYSYEEVIALKEHYRMETARLKDLEVAASKEIKLADSIRIDYSTDDEARDKEIDKSIDETLGKQPKR